MMPPFSQLLWEMCVYKAACQAEVPKVNVTAKRVNQEVVERKVCVLSREAQPAHLQAKKVMSIWEAKTANTQKTPNCLPLLFLSCWNIKHWSLHLLPYRKTRSSGVTSQTVSRLEYTTLTDEISWVWSEMSASQYKRPKCLKKENVRDSMRTLEAVLNEKDSTGPAQRKKDTQKRLCK